MKDTHKQVCMFCLHQCKWYKYSKINFSLFQFVTGTLEKPVTGVTQNLTASQGLVSNGKNR